MEPVLFTNAANFYITCQQGGHWINHDVVTRGLADNMHEAYGKHYHQLDPFYALPPHPRRALADEDIIDWPQYIRGEYFNDFLTPQGIHHQMNVWVQGENGIYGVLALFRPRAKTAFDREDRLLCELTASFLSGAFRKVYHQKNHWKMRRLARTLVEEAPFRGVLVIGRPTQGGLSQSNSVEHNGRRKKSNR